jgi:hypothetical protein
LVNVEKKLFDCMVIVPLDAGEKASHRDKLPFVGDGLVILETWGVGNEAVRRKVFCTPCCRDILLYNDLEGGVFLVDISGKTGNLNEGRLAEKRKVLR